jgi:hypothetical protein
MKPKPRDPEQDDLLRPRLTDMIDLRHELVKLAALIDWEFFEEEWAEFFPSHTGGPATSPRLVAGLPVRGDHRDAARTARMIPDSRASSTSAPIRMLTPSTTSSIFPPDLRAAR